MAGKCAEVYFPSLKMAFGHWTCRVICLRCFFLMIFVGFAPSCFNPFFPPTDSPPSSSTLTSTSLRGSPQSIIRQLIDAYQKKDLELYQDLFSLKQDFRFYISPTFASEHVDPTCEKVDSICSYILGKGLSCLKYWTYSQEMKSHARMFEKADQISLTISSISPSDIRYIVDKNGDTTNVEIIMRDGSLEIDEQVQIDKDGNRTQAQNLIPNLGEQVFYLERDSQNPGLWVIWKWFDLNTMM
jgi:hypothetical protein